MNKNTIENKQQYLFTMAKLKNSLRLPNIVVDFNPIQKSISHIEQIVPVFNLDKLFYTSCFILNADKKFLESSLGFEQLKFQQRVRNSYEKNIDNPKIFAEPTSRYCQVCQVNFHEYLQHINSQEHQMSNKKNQANKLISQLCKQYENSNQKTKHIKKDSKNTAKNNEIKLINRRYLRSAHQNKLIEEQTMKNFSSITTKVNTSQITINAL